MAFTFHLFVSGQLGCVTFICYSYGCTKELVTEEILPEIYGMQFSILLLFLSKVAKVSFSTRFHYFFLWVDDIKIKRSNQNSEPRILCVGDGIKTDILGGINEGLDTLFICGGLSGHETGITKIGDNPDPKKLSAFLTINNLKPTNSIGFLKWGTSDYWLDLLRSILAAIF